MRKKEAEKSDEKSGDGAEGHEVTELAVLAVNPMQGDTPEEQISVDEIDPEVAENATVVIDSPSSPGPSQQHKRAVTLAAVLAIMVILSMLVIVAAVVASVVPRGRAPLKTGRGQQ